jgi:hypothetical protein
MYLEYPMGGGLHVAPYLLLTFLPNMRAVDGETLAWCGLGEMRAN